MSKSLGNVIAPQKVFDSLGADILRLWVAATDYSGELSISDEILKRVTESYRRIRNTLRFLLSNTADFDIAKDGIALNELLEIDRYAIAAMKALQAELMAHYEKFEFHPVVAKLQTYCSEELGSLYLDILKDRLYTSGTSSKARRSAQTALWHISHALLRLMAPILSFTAEEAWKAFASPEEFTASDETIFTLTAYELPDIADGDTLLAKYESLKAIRADVMKHLEDVRIAGQIGSSLQAEIEIRASGDRYRVLSSLGEDLKFLMITSRADVVEVSDEAAEAITVRPSANRKCERCWHYRDDVGSDPAHPLICPRCAANLFGFGEKRRFV